MRYVLGPAFDAPFAYPLPDPIQPSVAFVDLVPSLSSIDPVGKALYFAVPAAVPSAPNLLSEIRGYLMPQGTVIDESPDAYLNSDLSFGTVSTAGILDGGNVFLQLPTPNVPGAYVGRVLYGYAS